MPVANLPIPSLADGYLPLVTGVSIDSSQISGAGRAVDIRLIASDDPQLQRLEHERAAPQGWPDGRRQPASSLRKQAAAQVRANPIRGGLCRPHVPSGASGWRVNGCTPATRALEIYPPSSPLKISLDLPSASGDGEVRIAAEALANVVRRSHASWWRRDRSTPSTTVPCAGLGAWWW